MIDVAKMDRLYSTECSGLQNRSMVVKISHDNSTHLR